MFYLYAKSFVIVIFQILGNIFISFQMVINIEHENAKMAPVNFGDKVGPVPNSLPVPSLLAVPGSSSNLAPLPNMFPGPPMVSVKIRTSLGYLKDHNVPQAYLYLL